MSFDLSLPDEKVIQQEIIEQVKPADEEKAKLLELAKSNVESIMSLDVDSLEQKKKIIKSVDEFGLTTMTASSNKNAMLKVQVGNLSKSGEEGGTVAKGLTDLQLKLQDLDPSGIDFVKGGLLGKLFNPLRAYFARYQKADAVIADILTSLDKGKATLKNDSTTLEIEQQVLRDLTKRLQKEIELGQFMDEGVERLIAEAEARGDSEEKIRFAKEEVLFPLRQRVMDMNQMLVVNQQGIMAMEVIIRNNKELMRGVERAKNVTVTALRIAVTVASALYNQKIVLEKITALNETTNNIISSTSKMLKDQGVKIQQQAMETNVSVETLKTAFTDVISALDSISTFKQAALPKMKDTIAQFRELADTGEKQIQQLERGSRIGV